MLTDILMEDEIRWSSHRAAGKGKHGRGFSDSTSLGTLTSSLETKTKSPSSPAKPAQQEDGVWRREERGRGGEGEKEGEQWRLSLF